MRLALALAKKRRRGVVVNADSAQVYSDLAVLSARPTKPEMQGIEHRLFGTWDGAAPCSAADWANEAKLAIAEIHAAGAVPILAGGTGLYIRTLFEGIAPIPPIDPAIRQGVRALPLEAAYEALKREDPPRAELLNPGDASRICRALEVKRATGKPLAYWQERREGGIAGEVTVHPAIILPDREELYVRCDARFEKMMEGGAVEEVEALLARKLSPALPVMRAIGVPEVAGWLLGEWDREEALVRGRQATRNYAKRQYTWFRRQPKSWPQFESHDYPIEDYFERLLLN